MAVPLGEAARLESVDVRAAFSERSGLVTTRPTVAIPVSSGTGVTLYGGGTVLFEPALLDLEEVDMLLSSLSALARYGWGCRWP